MTVEDLLGIVKGGWRVVINTKTSADPESGVRVESARIADASRPAAFIDVTPVDGVVDIDQIAKTLVFLNGGVARAEGRDDNAQRLVLAFLAHDQNRPLPLPRGMQYAPAPDGATITDDRGTELGSIDRGASLAEAGEAVVGAIATRAAGGLISRSSTAPPASSEEMSASATIGGAQIDELLAGLQGMPAEQRPVPADPSADDIKRMKVARIAECQKQLLSDVKESIRTKGVFLKGTLSADALASVCQNNEHTFLPTNGRGGKITGYQILDSGGDVVASGRLKTPIFPPGSRYLTQAAVQSLRDQINDQTFPNLIKGLPPDVTDDVHDADEEVDQFADDHPVGADDRDRDQHGEGPDESSTGKR
jgi:hypothetical protein